MTHLRFAPFAAVALLAAAPLAPAQQLIGILVQAPLATSAGYACGFDCNDPGNTRVLQLTTSDTISVYLYGDAGLPAALAVGLGPAVGACPAIRLPGIGNGLQILPTNFILLMPAPAPQPIGRTICPSGGTTTALSQLTIPAAASGATLTWQGLVHDQGAPALTRPVETPIL